jgi:uncharacterized protein (UPF0248 family)
MSDSHNIGTAVTQNRAKAKIKDIMDKKRWKPERKTAKKEIPVTHINAEIALQNSYVHFPPNVFQLIIHIYHMIQHNTAHTTNC